MCVYPTGGVPVIVKRNGSVEDEGYRQRLVQWLRSEGIEPKDVPAWPGAIAYLCGVARIEVVLRDLAGGIVVSGNDMRTKSVWRRVTTPPPLEPQST